MLVPSEHILLLVIITTTENNNNETRLIKRFHLSFGISLNPYSSARRPTGPA